MKSANNPETGAASIEQFLEIDDTDTYQGF